MIATSLRTGYRAGTSTTVVADTLPELRLQPGQLICLLGPNGSGKSTLLRTLSGLQPALGGAIHIEGVERWSPAILAKKISLVLTDRVRGHNLTVDSLVALGRYPWSGWLGGLDATDRERIEWAIGETGIGPFRERKVHTLSDGQFQKVMLARALAQDTPILMLDEPTAHLDLPSRIRLMRLLHGLARSTRKAILLSTHELDLALQIADEVWLLQSGGQLYSGAPEDLVLNGIFEAAFAEEEVTFDKEAGSFIIHALPGKSIRLTGEGLALLWTRRALRRAGYSTTPDGDRHVHVEERSGRLVWRLQPSTQSGEHAQPPLQPDQTIQTPSPPQPAEYDSIQKLLQAIG